MLSALLWSCLMRRSNQCSTIPTGLFYLTSNKYS